MLHSFKVTCSYQGNQPVNYHWGSLMHGILLSMLPASQQEALHAENLRPFSHYVLPLTEPSFFWHIGVWDDSLANEINNVLTPSKEILVRQKGAPITIDQVEHESLSEQDWFSKFFASSIVCRRYELSIQTPSTHKSEGRYVIFPTPELIINNLYRRYSAFSSELSLDDTQTMKTIAQNSRIIRYSLHSTLYDIEKTHIFGYKGRLTLAIDGPEQLARLAGAVLMFASYAGVGIKTSLGMGGCEVREMNNYVKVEQDDMSKQKEGN